MRVLTASTLLAVSIPLALAAQAHTQDVRVEPITRQQAEAIKASWQSARLQPLTRLDTTLLIVPFFVVDRLSASGVTTLFAVQGDMIHSTALEIHYEDPFGNVFLTENPTLGPSGVLTVNIRDKKPPILTQGFAFGRVVIQTSSNRRINGDFYRVDPGANFAVGDGLISAADMCLIEDVRYAVGGIFDDTVITYHFLNLSTPAMGGQTAAVGEIFDEAGTYFKSFILHLPNGYSRTDLITASGLFQSIGQGPPFGTLRFNWNPNTVGAGVISSETSADGRFSVGLQGACRKSLLEALP